MRFSTKFSTFASWIRNANKTYAYTKRVSRLHDLSPRSSLSGLRKLRVADIDLSRKPLKSLTTKQYSDRRLALEIKRMMKSGTSLSSASRQRGMSKSKIIKHLGRSIIKKGNKWIPNTYDTIQRAMNINEKGRVVSIIVTNSDDAKYISKYYNAVHEYLKTGDRSLLKPFKKRAIYDADGVKHKLETNPDKIREIEEKKEDSEFWEIYTDEI